MRTRRAAGHVPGFAAPPSPEASREDAGPTDSVEPSLLPVGTRQLHTRIPADLHRRYRHLLRDLEDAGIESSMTELVCAVLDEGPRNGAEARARLREWRRRRSALD